MNDKDMPASRHTAPNTLAAAIRRGREAAGLSVRQLAPLVGAHHSVLSRIEAGAVARPSPELVQNIAAALELDPSDLLAFIGVKSTMPEPKVYFRRAYGMSETEAAEAASIIENLRAHQQEEQ
ncbi:helix-turn-helix domain-containing protein [Amycolatopsis sp. H20-H5]|uniref:helix-turn-helix domain-containing protein n=1 Tax=Amycolatopsis sp. H20-H5 TaxID=3046309 RepID=UPI002DBB9D25|nr:helix-turn-helix transcriptional regulator [Amycolatopsis sp. H20-H5]MEC3976231.1 helix-turn-helix transcriptional regulator [Amycolatopsis sp. H20-H5]